VNHASNGKRRPLQFNLKTLLLAVGIAAAILAVWRIGGPVGVAVVAAFLLPPLGFACFGAKPGQPILLGAAGGAWTAAAVVVGILCISGPSDPLHWYLHLGITLAGVALGSFYGALRHIWLTRKNRWPDPRHARFFLRRHGWRLGILLSIGAGATFLLGRWVERRRFSDPSADVVITDIHGWVHRCELAGHGIDDARLAAVIHDLPKTLWHIRLVFYHTRVTDAGVTLLHDVPNLYSVDLRGTQATAQAVAALRQAQSDCEILW
jgi:hypothetical protein